SLLALVRKELVRPERAELTAGDAFKFRHLLIRDAAYDALPKAERTELHERFADWLERIVGDRLTEYQEVVGFHLEQAHAYRIQLGLADATTASLGSRAADRLGAAAMRAEARRDAPAANGLLVWTIALTSNAPERGKLMLRQAGLAYALGQTQRIQELLAEATAIGDREGDDLLRAHADMS